MKTMHAIVFMLLIGTAMAVTTVQQDTSVCACSQIQFQTDCNNIQIPSTTTPVTYTKCAWVTNTTATGTQAKGTCSTPTTTTTPTVTATATYCSGLAVAACPGTFGCALPDGKTCQAFTGCSAYVFTTVAACQAISTLCTTDGVQCSIKAACSTYSTTTAISTCASQVSLLGTGNCKISPTSSSTCVDPSCSDAPTTLTTNAACSAYNSTCPFTTGQGCTATLGSCTTYNGNATTCPLFKGIEGTCKFVSGTTCSAQLCTDAPITNTTAAQCASFLANATCFTTGQGCSATAQNCATYKSSTGCTQYVDATGSSLVPCVIDTSVTPATNCRTQVCTDNTTATSTSTCATFVPGGNCVTSGQGCVASGQNICANYKGTNVTCKNYVGSAGPCKGTTALATDTTTVAACTVQTCADGTSGKTNTACNAVQTGCLSNGVQCQTTLSPCSSYTNSPTTCDTYVDSNGPCTSDSAAPTNCIQRACASAGTSTFSTKVTTFNNTNCIAWNPRCVANAAGTACVDGNTLGCTNLSTTQCKGFSTCQSPSSCLQTNDCTQLGNQSQCLSQTGANGRICTWNGSTCGVTACPSSGAAFTTDSACQNTAAGGYPGCYWSGATAGGCLDASAACGSLTGDATYTANGCIQQLGGKCVFVTSACVARSCANFVQQTAGSTDNTKCNAWLAGCVTNGYQGCLDPTTLNLACSNYQGTQATCDALTVGGKRCWLVSTTTPGNCVDKTAAHILTSSTQNTAITFTDAQCIAQLSTSVSSGTSFSAANATGVCTDSATKACSSYTLSPSGCNLVQGGGIGKFCVQYAGFCYQKTAATCASQTLSSLTNCQKYSPLCSWIGGTTCVTAQTTCSAYTTTLGNTLNAAICLTLVDLNGNPCGAATGTITACKSAVYCQDYAVTGSTANTVCATLKDLFGNPCSAAVNDATCSYTSITSATAVYALGSGFCATGNYNNVSVCAAPTAVTCSGASGLTSQVQCTAYGASCIWNGITSCVATAITTCAGYVGVVTQATCALVSAAGKRCIFNKTSNAGCSVALDCTAVTTSITTETTLTDAVCQSYTDTTGASCRFVSSACAAPGACASYVVASGEAAAALACTTFIDNVNFKPCYFPGGAGTACAALVATCAGYTPTAASKDQQCRALNAVTAGTPNIYTPCGFQTGAGTCSNRQCSDQVTASTGGPVDNATCNAYLTGCFWNGVNCGTTPTGNFSCSGYAVTAAASPATAVTSACRLLADSKGRLCDYVANAASCSDRLCSTVASPTTNANCIAQSPACALANNACIVALPSCYHYIGTAVTDCTKTYDQKGRVCAAPQSPSLTCSYPLCSTVTAPANAAACTNVNPGCVFISSSVACAGPAGACSSYSFGVTAPTPTAGLATCSTFVNAQNGKKCTYTNYSLSSNAPIRATTCSETADSTNAPVCGSANATIPGAPTDADCTAFNVGCTATPAATGNFITSVTTYSVCNNSSCSLNTSATTNPACNAFFAGCVTNGAGCISPDQDCTKYTGTTTTCLAFVGSFGVVGSTLGIPCYQSSLAATTTATAAACAPKTCALATGQTSDTTCEAWYPSTFNTNFKAATPKYNLNCVYNGSGCVAPQNCSLFTGTALTCGTFTALDGPCKFVSGSTCTPVVCTDAPNTYTTDAQCKAYANTSQSCITTGYGCISKPASPSCSLFQTTAACTASVLQPTSTQLTVPVTTYSNNCNWVASCVAPATTCGAQTTASSCLSVPVVGTDGVAVTCAWAASLATPICRPQTCADLPATFTTHTQCNSAVTPVKCTTTGAGCVAYDKCSTYTTSAICGAASNTDTITKCIWSNNQCRVIQCSDNTTATATTQCNVNGLTGCVTTGNGCIVASGSSCSSFNQTNCLIASSPCLYVFNGCQEYSQCQSVLKTTHADCQKVIVNASATPLCTTNGTTCIPLNTCLGYGTNSAGCVKSNTGTTCGFIPATSLVNGTATPVGTCTTFTSCTSGNGATTPVCKLWGGNTCVSNGTSCMVQTTCGSYTTPTGCNNGGTDGNCTWVPVNGTVAAFCRLATCADATATTYPAGTTNDALCAAYQGPLINTCTSNGTICIQRATCASYALQPGCLQGTDGACIWQAPPTGSAATVTGTCRVKICTDVISSNNNGCANQVIATPATTTAAGVTTPATTLKCVSNGTTCIPQSTCSTYVNQVACQGSGTDGACSFTVGSVATTPTIGTCKLTTQCSDANNDSVSCLSYPSQCFWASNTTGTTTTTSCTPITCAQYATATGGTCKPVPAWGKTPASYSVCIPTSATNSACVAGDASGSPQATCLSGSLQQYTWNDTSSLCQQCVTSTTNNTNNTNNTNTTTYGSIIASSFLIYGAILAIY